MLLETAQHSHIAFIHHGPAEARNVARAGVMALLRRRLKSHQNKRKNEKNSEHLIAPCLANFAWLHLGARSNSAALLKSMSDKRANRNASLVRICCASALKAKLDVDDSAEAATASIRCRTVMSVTQAEGTPLREGPE